MFEVIDPMDTILSYTLFTHERHVKLSDYIMQRLVEHGIRHVFVVTGGAAMHLNDSLGKESRLTPICNHHEQASAMAAEGYARITGGIGVACATAGPGAINAINGVFGAWTDSIPVLVLSGQSKRETLTRTYDLSDLRQLGDQEVDIVRMVSGITKYAVCVTDENRIRYHLEKALYLATAGRPGPVWLDIPVDVQATDINPEQQVGFSPEELTPEPSREQLGNACKEILNLMENAERPVILAGSGVRLSGSVPQFHEMVETLGIPVTTAWTHDTIASDHSLFMGRPATIGERAGNFTVQNSDLLLILGSRLNIRQIS